MPISVVKTCNKRANNGVKKLLTYKLTRWQQNSCVWWEFEGFLALYRLLRSSPKKGGSVEACAAFTVCPENRKSEETRDYTGESVSSQISFTVFWGGFLGGGWIA